MFCPTSTLPVKASIVPSGAICSHAATFSGSFCPPLRPPLPDSWAELSPPSAKRTTSPPPSDFRNPRRSRRKTELSDSRRRVSGITISLRHGAHCVRCFLDGRYNSVLSTAAADISFQLTSDLRFGRRWISSEKPHALHDHARCAVSALHRVAVHKGLL